MKKKDSLLLIIGLVLFSAALIYYLYLVSKHDWFSVFTHKDRIGDAIGGITAPIIGILGAVLIYISFKTQVRANKLLINQNKFELFIGLVNEFKKDINYLYDRKNWKKENERIQTPFLTHLKKENINDIPPLFKRKLMYIFNDYIFLDRRLKELKNLEKSEEFDKTAIIYSLNNIYDCYLDNFCIGYKELKLEKKPKAKLSKKIQELAKKIIEINENRPIMRVEDELD